MVATWASFSQSQVKAPCGNQVYVSRWDRSVFDNVVRFCLLRKSDVNEAHDPPDYLVHKVALVLPI